MEEQHEEEEWHAAGELISIPTLFFFFFLSMTPSCLQFLRTSLTGNSTRRQCSLHKLHRYCHTERAKEKKTSGGGGGEGSVLSREKRSASALRRKEERSAARPHTPFYEPSSHSCSGTRLHNQPAPLRSLGVCVCRAFISCEVSFRGLRVIKMIYIHSYTGLNE